MRLTATTSRRPSSLRQRLTREQSRRNSARQPTRKERIISNRGSPPLRPDVEASRFRRRLWPWRLPRGCRRQLFLLAEALNCCDNHAFSSVTHLLYTIHFYEGVKYLFSCQRSHVQRIRFFKYFSRRRVCVAISKVKKDTRVSVEIQTIVRIGEHR